MNNKGITSCEVGTEIFEPQETTFEQLVRLTNTVSQHYSHFIIGRHGSLFRDNGDFNIFNRF
jgi:hypothetical protein